MYKGFPVYEAKIKSNTDGVIAISLVEDPAVNSEFVCFKKDDKIQKFSIDNEEERIITGVVMLADSPIYRRNGDFEYYIVFSRDTIKQMASKMLADGTFSNNDIQHNGRMIAGLELLELYIKDEKKGINPNFLDVPDGSLLASYHVTDDALWDEVKNGNFLNGFSLEGYFDVAETEQKYNKINKNTKMKLIEKFLKNLVKFSEIATDKGTILIQEGDELAVGVDVYVETEEGEWAEAADGEYALEDGRTVVVAEGKVAEIKDPEAIEEPVVDEPAVEEPVEAEDEVVEEIAPVEDVRDEKQEQIDALKEAVAGLKADIESLRAALAEIVQQPAAEPIVEEFSKAKEADEVKGLTGGQKKAYKLFSNK